jgi:hypothetical protein
MGEEPSCKLLFDIEMLGISNTSCGSKDDPGGAATPIDGTTIFAGDRMNADEASSMRRRVLGDTGLGNKWSELNFCDSVAFDVCFEMKEASRRLSMDDIFSLELSRGMLGIADGNVFEAERENLFGCIVCWFSGRECVTAPGKTSI